MKRQRCAFELKAVDAEARTFEGYGSIFNVPDDGRPPDVVLPGAFAKTIQEWGPSGANRIKILALHRYDWLPIGRPIELREDARGLYLKAQLSETSLGRDVLTLIKDGVLTELSIGYDPIKDELDRAAGVRKLSEVRLYEISPVTWAMHPQALIASAKELMHDLRANPDIFAEFKALLAETEPPVPGTPSPGAAADSVADPELIQSLRALNAELKTCVGRT